MKNKPNKVRRTFTFDEDVINKFENRCRKELRPLSTVLNQTIKYMSNSKMSVEEMISTNN
jgi:hypothetical protein